MRRCTPDGSHYEVVSPWIRHYYGGYEPPEDFRCYGVYFAQNAKAAKVKAIADPEFKEWRDDSAGSPPFKGLETRLFRCEHDSCYSCTARHHSGTLADIGSFGCDECDAIYAKCLADEAAADLTG